MTQRRANALSLLSIESDFLRKIIRFIFYCWRLQSLEIPQNERFKVFNEFLYFTSSAFVFEINFATID